MTTFWWYCEKCQDQYAGDGEGKPTSFPLNRPSKKYICGKCSSQEEKATENIKSQTALPLAQERIRKLEEEVKVTDKLLQERDRLLEAIPKCPAHGLCIPHAVEWVNQVKTLARIIVGDHKGE